MPESAPKFAIGDNVTALIKGRVTAVTEYANGYFSYRITGTEPTGDRYNKFIDEQFVLHADDQARDGAELPAFVTRAA